MASEAPATAVHHETPSHTQQLDLEKLHALPSEQQDLYLLTFVSDLTRHVASLDADGATSQQLAIKNELLKIINLPSPAPTRIIRNNIGSIFSGILSKSDRKILFETANELHAILNSGKFEKTIKNKHAAVYALGAIFETAGDSAISLAPLLCTTFLRLLKATQNYAGLRASLFKSLGRVVKGVGKSLDETIARDIWKQARSFTANDKAYLVQAQSCWCMEQLFMYCPFFDNTNDFDRLLSALWKAMDCPAGPTRAAAANCLASVLAKHFSGSAVTFKKQKKTKPKQTEEINGDAQVDRSGSPVPGRSGAALSFTLIDILRQLSAQYTRSSSSNRVRAALALCYSKVFKKLDVAIIQHQYAAIARHFFEDLLCSPAILTHRYRLLITRKFVRINLHLVIGRNILGEASQLGAIRFLVSGILKDYPPSDVKERPEPHKECLTAALDTLDSLINNLGPATSGCSDLCRDGLLQILQHPSHTVQVHASKCLQSLMIASPHQLLPTATICMNNIQREIGLLTTLRRAPRRCVGFALGLAALVNTASEQPLYGSVDVYSRILSQATSILKSSSGSDIRMSSTQIQVAWIMIGSLMALGPNFVKIHLNQLLLMWKNALPKPLSKENIGQRGFLEVSFLAHVRECALGSIRAFLTYNGRLLTVDVSRRLALMLQNTTEFLNTLPERKVTDEDSKMLSPSLQLRDYDLMLRRRIFECYMRLFSLAPDPQHESLLQTSILSMAISSFASPDNLATGSFSSSVAAASTNLENIWEVGDNLAFGLTGLVRREEIKSLFLDEEGRDSRALASNSIEAKIDETIQTPVCGDLEHDAIQLYASSTSEPPDPLVAAVINSAIRLFAKTIFRQSPKVQHAALEQVSAFLASTIQQQSTVKSLAASINVAVALLLALNAAIQETPQSSFVRTNPEVEKAMQELLHGFVVSTDQSLRIIAAEALGRLCKTAGSEFSTKEVHHLVETIVSNREPHPRSGCAMALGSIHTQLGGMAAGLHLKNIVGVLTSLASDPHPTVHFWALEALSRVADSAGLAFSGFVSSTLGMIAQLYVLDTHNEETAPTSSSNLEVELPTCTSIARCVDSLINVLGPDLQDVAKTRNMILTLTYQFQLENDPLVTTESLRCLEHLSMYAPGHISFAPYVRQLQSKLSDDNPDICDTALKGLYNVMRRGAEDVLATADPSLESQLWLALDDAYGQGTIRKIILDWVEQSGLSRIDSWTLRIQKALTTVRKPKEEPITQHKEKDSVQDQGNEEINIPDEEVAGFNAASKADKDESGSTPGETQELLRWQVRFVAMNCLNQILAAASKDIETKEDSTALELLLPRVADIIRIAFSASTAAVVEIRIRGIQVIEKILEIFGRVPDPDFPEVNLLEQYQAQISSALTPAFAADSSPALAAEAVGVCATFLSTGIVRDKERMGRILKQLVSALEDFSKADVETTSIGDLKGLGSSAQIMVKLSVYSAWAKMQVASREHKQLKDIVAPHLANLTPLWLNSLKEYARLKFEPDVSSNGPIAGNSESIYAALNRESLLKFYQSSWLELVHAIASLIDEDSEFVFDALDDKDHTTQTNGDVAKRNEISYRDEPVAFFFVLFGISYEALISSSSVQSQVTQQSMLEILEAMKKIFLPSVAGLAIYQDAVFTETMDLLDRLALTEGPEIQSAIVQIAEALSSEHPAARRSQGSTDAEQHLSDDTDQLFELTRIIVLVISSYIPNLSEDTSARPQLSEGAVDLVTLALDALVKAAAVFPVVIQSDLQACIFHVFSTILGTAVCQESLVPQALPILRRFLSALVQNPHHDTVSQLRTALSKFLAILKNAQKRENEASIPCEKNTLLACTILITTTSRLLEASDPLLSHFAEMLIDCLHNRMTTKVAAGLSRSLLLLPVLSRGKEAGGAGPAGEAIAASLFPLLIDFCVHPSEIEETDETRVIIAQALTGFVLAVPPERKPIAYNILIPTLLQRAAKEGKAVWEETSVLLMDIVGKDPTNFRFVVARLSSEQRALLEEIIKSGGLGSKNAAATEEDTTNKEPSIELKLDF